MQFSSVRGGIEMDNANSGIELLVEAAEHLRSAIELLDRASAPGHIAANVDLARNQLEDLIPAHAIARAAPPLNCGLGNS